MPRGLALGILGVAALLAATPAHTLNETIGQVRAALREKQKDEQVARGLRKWKLGEALEERAIEELQSEGAGPKTVAELERLREESANLPKAGGPWLFPAPPSPGPDEQARVLDEARQTALHYSDSLPNFMATEQVRRYNDEGGSGGWRLKDRIVLTLSYLEKQEDYQVVSINGRPSRLSYDEVGGTITHGEFGSLLREVFAARSATEMHWDHWTHLRGRPTHVFTFHVLAANSRYSMTAGMRSDGYTSSASVTVGQHGLVYVDAESRQVVRIFAETDSVPPEFPVRRASTLLDYDFAEVGGKRYLLPVRAESRTLARSVEYRNEVEFEQYRKFGAESSITFEGPVK